MNRFRYIFWVVLLLALPLTGRAQVFKISYVSAAHIYLNGGKRDGLQTGDTLTVHRQEQLVGKIRVDYVATHSASCGIIEKKLSFSKGDQARLKSRRRPVVAEQTGPRSKQEAVPPVATKPLRTEGPATPARIRGYLSLQYYHFKDLGPKSYDFSQPTLRFRIRIDELWTPGLRFEMKFRTRYNQRRRRYSGLVPKAEWQNRFYQLNLSYERPDAPVHFRLGRVISHALSGVGYIDGGLLQVNPATHWHLGAFAGTQPDWRTSGWQNEIQKYGVFTQYQKGRYGVRRTELTLAAAGEYHGATVSREFLFFRGSYYYGNRWNVNQQLELDLNRAWRKTRSGQSVSLSGLYISGRYNVKRNLSMNLSYDNRKNYYTYESRSIADSLFDATMRQGLRAGVNATVLKDYFISARFGVRDKQTDSRYSYNFGFNVRKRRFLSAFNFLFVSLAGFDNLFARGLNPNLRLSRRMAGGHYVSLNYGNYFYALKNNSGNRINQWLRLNAQLELLHRWFAAVNYEYDWGDDIRGHRIFSELGYRF